MRRVIIFTLSALLLMTTQAMAQWPAVNSNGGTLNVVPFGLMGAYNGKFVGAMIAGAGTGDIDIYTVPTSKKAIIAGVAGYNPTAGTINWYGQMKLSGTYRRVTGTIGSLTNTGSSAVANFILEAGDKLAIHTDATGLNVFPNIYEVDDTAPIKTASLASFSVGDNTLYTVPGGKTAMVQGNPVTGFSPPISSAAAVGYTNDSGLARTIYVAFIPSGGSSIQGAATGANVNNGSQAQRGIAPTLATGDAVILNTSSNAAGQFAWVTVLEF